MNILVKLLSLAVPMVRPV